MLSWIICSHACTLSLDQHIVARAGTPSTNIYGQQILVRLWQGDVPAGHTVQQYINNCVNIINQLSTMWAFSGSVIYLPTPSSIACNWAVARLTFLWPHFRDWHWWGMQVVLIAWGDIFCRCPFDSTCDNTHRHGLVPWWNLHRQLIGLWVCWHILDPYRECDNSCIHTSIKFKLGMKKENLKGKNLDMPHAIWR